MHVCVCVCVCMCVCVCDVFPLPTLWGQEPGLFLITPPRAPSCCAHPSSGTDSLPLGPWFFTHPSLTIHKMGLMRMIIIILISFVCWIKRVNAIKAIRPVFLTPLKYSVLYITVVLGVQSILENGLNESRFGIFPHGPTVRSPRFQWWGLRFSPFVGALRSCKPWAKKKKSKAGLNEGRRE